jgi:hypothetical protein
MTFKAIGPPGRNKLLLTLCVIASCVILPATALRTGAFLARLVSAVV